MKITKRQLKRIIREEAEKLNMVPEMQSSMGSWEQCKENLLQMASESGYVCCLCASKAIELARPEFPASMEECCQLISDCCEEGMLSPMPHTEMPMVTVYGIAV